MHENLVHVTEPRTRLFEILAYELRDSGHSVLVELSTTHLEEKSVAVEIGIERFPHPHQ